MEVALSNNAYTVVYMTIIFVVRAQLENGIMALSQAQEQNVGVYGRPVIPLRLI